MNDTWVKLYRRIGDHEILTDPNALVIFVYLMTNCDLEGKAKVSKYFTAGGLKMKPTTFLDALKRLEKKYKVIGLTPTNKYTEVSLLGWAKYQPHLVQPDQEPTKNRPQPDQEPTLIIKNKRIKNKEIIKTTSSSPSGDLAVFLEEFNKLFSRDFRITEGRRRQLNTRLKAYSFDEILQALRNMAKSPHHQGKNDRGWVADPDFLLSNDEKIDKWLNYKEGQGKGLEVIKIR